MERKEQYDPMQTTGTADTGTGTYGGRVGEQPSPGSSAILKGETGSTAERRDGTAYSSASENETSGDETSPLDELDDVVPAADDTGMVAQQQLLAQEAERPPER